MVSLYDMSIPVYIKALENLINVLKKGEKWADDSNVDHSKLIDARLYADMNVIFASGIDSSPFCSANAESVVSH